MERTETRTSTKPGAGPTNGKNADEARIRAGVESWTRAVSTKDAEAAMALYAPDVRSFELAPPLQMQGLPAVREALQEWLSGWKKLSFDVRDLEVHASDDSGYACFLNHLVGTSNDGNPMDIWVRVTLGLRKQGERWLVAHEHVSVPFHMDGSMRAALDLKP